MNVDIRVAGLAVILALVAVVAGASAWRPPMRRRPSFPLILTDGFAPRSAAGGNY